MKKILVLFFAFIALFMCFGAVKAYAEEGDYEVEYKGRTTTNVNVREGPGTKYDIVIKQDKTNLQLEAMKDVIIFGEGVADDKEKTIWYHLKVTIDGVEYTGYSTSNYVSKLEALPTPTPSPTPSPEPTPEPSITPTEVPVSTAPAEKDGNTQDNLKPNSPDKIMTAILVVVIVAVVALIGLLVFKLLMGRKEMGNNTSRKLDMLKKVNIDGQNQNNGRKMPQIKKSDFDRAYREDVKSEVYYRNTADDYYTDNANASMQADSDEKRALREAIDRLQEHDIVYHTIYGEGEVRDNSDVKLIEIRFDNDMRFLKKDQLVAKRELKIIDEEDQSIVRRRNRRRNNRR
ncbi:MAG: SH3 domain-containing protein [Lachnospiraceae bacterium]|nr:SH3 domain-containing protein [Lachnospiraceae bacterium]